MELVLGAITWPRRWWTWWSVHINSKDCCISWLLGRGCCTWNLESLMIMHVKLKAHGVTTLTFRFDSPPPITVYDAIWVTGESPSGYYEFLDVYCTTTPSVSPNSILHIYGSSNSLMHQRIYEWFRVREWGRIMLLMQQNFGFCFMLCPN